MANHIQQHLKLKSMQWVKRKWSVSIFFCFEMDNYKDHFIILNLPGWADSVAKPSGDSFWKQIATNISDP